MSRRLMRLKRNCDADADTDDDDAPAPQLDEPTKQRDRSLSRTRSDTDDLPPFLESSSSSDEVEAEKRVAAAGERPQSLRGGLVRTRSVTAMACSGGGGGGVQISHQSAGSLKTMSRRKLYLRITSGGGGSSGDVVSLEQAQRLFSALNSEKNATLLHETRLFSAKYHRAYASVVEFKRAYAEWSAAITLFKQTSFELWIKAHYTKTIWQVALNAAKQERVMHLGDAIAHASLTDPIARHYEVPYRHKLSFSGQSASESTIFFVLYTADVVFTRREDWVVESEKRFWNCFYCIPRDVAWRLYGVQKLGS